MKTTISYCLSLLLLIFTSLAFAEIYKWVDKNGKVHFSDKPPVEEQAELVDEAALAEKFSSYTHVTVAPIPFSVKLPESKKLVIYTTSRCGYCSKARKYFSENKIAYFEKNIEENEKYQNEFDRFGGTGVPVIFWKNKRMNGFSIEKFISTYGKSA